MLEKILSSKDELMIDEFTYGKSQAAANLVKILSEDQYANSMRKVTYFLSHHSKMIHQIMKIEDKQTRNYILNLMRENVHRTELLLPKVVKTHMLNVITARIREALHS